MNFDYHALLEIFCVHHQGYKALLKFLGSLSRSEGSTIIVSILPATQKLFKALHL